MMPFQVFAYFHQVTTFLLVDHFNIIHFPPFLLRPSRVFATHIILILCHILSNWFPYFKILIIDIESLDFSALSFLVLHYHILSSWGCCLESTCFSIFQSLSLHVFLFSCENFCLRNLTDDVYMRGNL